MTKLIKMFSVALLLLVIGCKKQNNNIVDIRVSDLQTVTSTHSEIQLVDVRTPEECKNGMINKAINIDVTSPDFEEKALRELKKDAPVYLYCRSGGRSIIAAEMLAEKGFEIYNLEGGYLNWKEENK
ncbi:Rhodanese-related sulfurtransferase [Tenacibaculum sp. MAR_2009_124]|uniref:rhodanese-like domain-containing protein n=1 Tax=Tenacibaculum sp. MAR_2009_124 TaxID=1250059 RepID=UPI0008973294|nr:rhodanese-like domain-containing protein [Tenacibaculum sp. MAR_2009_124]SEB98607.1 Rhodanese-related sulfurtransferase [Tenacibaculum sp. MAR_2009_124]